jgi:hypothetical protein
MICRLYDGLHHEEASNVSSRIVSSVFSASTTIRRIGVAHKSLFYSIVLQTEYLDRIAPLQAVFSSYAAATRVEICKSCMHMRAEFPEGEDQSVKG